MKNKEIEITISSKSFPYVNIGTRDFKLLLPLSNRLIKILKKEKFVHFAIYESLKCYKISCFSAGIMAYSQLLNCFSEKTPKQRHDIAHKFLQIRPTKTDHDDIAKKLIEVAKNSYENELKKSLKSKDKFDKDLSFQWGEYYRELFLNYIKNEK